MKEPLWIDDISVLFRNITEFWPDPNKSINKQINAMVRYIFICTGIIAYIRKSPIVIIIGILLAILVTTVMSNCNGYSFKQIFLFITGKSKQTKKVEHKKQINTESCKQNPMQNNIPFSEKNEACNDNTIEHFEPITDPNDKWNRRNNSYHNFYNIPEQNMDTFGSFLTEDADFKTNTYYSSGIGSFIN